MCACSRFHLEHGFGYKQVHQSYAAGFYKHLLLACAARGIWTPVTPDPIPTLQFALRKVCYIFQYAV